MARPRSEGKRNAILDAATEVVAKLGVSAPTAKIARDAGVAEGTLFTYFSSKGELLNQLYLELKSDLAEAMTAGYPFDKNLLVRTRHVWNSYVGWCSAHPLKHKAMTQLGVSERVTEKTKKLGAESFKEVNQTLREILAGGAWPFNSYFFFIFNVAVGGNWPGPPNATTQFPQRMFVDYVRVFQ